MENEKIKVMVVDDSPFMRMILKDIIDQQPDMKVIAVAKDGMEAVELALKHRPDVITMDVEMPKLNGIEAVKEIMKRAPTRIIMVSSLTEEGAEITLLALELGAVDFVTKPSGSVSMDFRKMAPELVQKIRDAMKIGVNQLLSRRKPVSGLKVRTIVSGKIVVIGSSTGGPRSLDLVIPPLPKDFPAPILIVQHMPPGFTKSLAQRLDRISNISVKEAEEGDELKPGWAYVAPGDFHMGVKYQDRKGIIYLDKKTEKINNVRPSVDYTLDKVAEIYKENTIAVILTGMGKDGTKGAFKVKFFKGIVIAESPETCVVYGMPKAVVEEGYADFVLPADKIPEKLAELV
ncbi:chemotaxis response regulator protein-glutamate methylesterase [Fervidobacterium thailandense]|uniref:Protein-glutamate methylesterase/protein-glutamine glutaminase n=2 Tax=Fervidobacterium thailandense TaxID=1008305 RepID=A0A1E3G0N3_9BACT|nr:chemotaxis response regulator protein-glutamate methylesterase [Fervidobacterium thailandense]ODN29700.1 chemotaxis response regulator protein-glutamate methylesterase [Fervidobacterium thailandense]